MIFGSTSRNNCIPITATFGAPNALTIDNTLGAGDVDTTPSILYYKKMNFIDPGPPSS